MTHYQRLMDRRTDTPPCSNSKVAVALYSMAERHKKQTENALNVTEILAGGDWTRLEPVTELLFQRVESTS